LGAFLVSCISKLVFIDIDPDFEYLTFDLSLSHTNLNRQHVYYLNARCQNALAIVSIGNYAIDVTIAI